MCLPVGKGFSSFITGNNSIQLGSNGVTLLTSQMILHPNREVVTNVDVCGSVTAKPEQAGSLVGAGYGRVQGVTLWYCQPENSKAVMGDGDHYDHQIATIRHNLVI